MIKKIIVICMIILNAVLAVSFLSGRNDILDVVEAAHLIDSQLEFFGSKEIKSHTVTLSGDAIKNKDALVLSYDLRGACLYSGPASALTLISKNGKEYSVPLSAYGENCKEGTQTVQIPFKDFSIRESLDNITSFRAQFWLPTEYSLAISRITLENRISENEDGFFVAAINKIAQNSTATPKSLPISSTLRKMPTPTPKPSGGWTYCATESGKCSFTGTKEIRYGVNGKYSFKVYSDGIDCHNNVFGDPIKGSLKYCYIRSTTSVAIAGVKPSATAKPQKPVRTPTPTPIPTSIFVARPSLTTTPTLLATPVTTPQVLASSWAIRSVSSMKETKDKVCNQDSAAFIDLWINKAIELGVNYIAVETPYDNPKCGSAVAYTKAWVDAIHARGLNVWHRHMPLAFEGIYDTPKNNTKDYLTQIRNYIKDNPTFFKKGDIFTPIPEPQNGGIKGVTYCHQSICMFDGATSFNKWLRDAITASEESFAAIQLGGQMKIGYYGFDGFVAWGDNNPDWEGILETATVNAMGNITIDHYPEIVGDTMANDLKELTEKYPNTPIIIGEWGTITGGDTVAQVQKSMQAAKIPNVTGFNYWHAGIGGNEALFESSFRNKAQFEAVKSFFIK